MNIAPPGVRVFSLCWGGFHCLFTREEKRIFFLLPLPPFSFFVNVLCLLYRYIITREDKLLLNYHSRLLFLLSLFIPESQKKSSFLPWRKINTREGWDLEGICWTRTPFHLLVGVLSRNHDLSRHVYMAGIARGVAASYRGQGFLGIRGNTSRGGWEAVG